MAVAPRGRVSAIGRRSIRATRVCARSCVLMGPGTVGVAAAQINLFVNTLLATGQGTGAVSWLNYAFRLMYMPIGIFGVSVATAALPGDARDMPRPNDTSGIRQTLSASLRLMLMLNVPATLGLMALARPIVELIFERGRFTRRRYGRDAAALLVLRPGPRRLLGREAHRLADLLCASATAARRSSSASSRLAATSCSTSRSVRAHGLSRAGAGHGDRRPGQRRPLLWLLRGRLDGIDGRRVGSAVREDRSRIAGHGRGGACRSNAGCGGPAGRPVLLRNLPCASAPSASPLLALAASARLLRIRGVLGSDPEARRAAR